MKNTPWLPSGNVLHSYWKWAIESSWVFPFITWWILPKFIVKVYQRVNLQISYGFLMVFLWFAHVPLGFPIGFPMVFLGFSHSKLPQKENSASETPPPWARCQWHRRCIPSGSPPGTGCPTKTIVEDHETIPSGNLTELTGKSLCLMEKSTISMVISIVMLNYQRVNVTTYDITISDIILYHMLLQYFILDVCTYVCVQYWHTCDCMILRTILHSPLINLEK